MDSDLEARLVAAGVDPGSITDPQAAFVQLVEVYGAAATIHDRFALEAHVLGVERSRLSGDDRARAVEGFYGLRWEGFEIVGVDRADPVEVEDYQPHWPHLFVEWRDRLGAALGPVAKRIEHVGSTAVAGLAAKPIVDIQVSVDDLEDEAAYVPPIESAGVSLRSRDADHRYFRPPPGQPRTVHVHVCRAGGAWEADHLLFRDYLRAHPKIRDAYGALKLRLVGEFRGDRLGYTEAKSSFVDGVMQDAERWRDGVRNERIG